VFSSLIYGIAVRSEWPLGLRESATFDRADVELRRGDAHLFIEAAQVAKNAPGAALWFQRVCLPDGWLYLRWTDLFEFLVSPDGRMVRCNPLAKATDESFRVYLLNQVLSFAMLRQGIEQLHATVAVVEGGAVAFVGDCGYGKSSLGAAFLAAGDQILTDDLLVVEHAEEKLLAYPGPRRIKLFPEIAHALLPQLASGTPMNNVTPKLVIPLDRCMVADGPRPLRAIYMLVPATRVRTRDRVCIRQPASPAAFLSLVRNTFNTVITDPERLKQQFAWAMDIAARVPIRLLSYPRDLKLLPQVREAVLKDLQRKSRRGLVIRRQFANGVAVPAPAADSRQVG
jgi:hypothetical protein